MEVVANKYLKVLVTGASGFIGRKLSFALAEMGFEVIALCRNIKHPFLIQHRNIRLVKGDILDLVSLEHAMEDCYQVYHTAAMAKMWCKNEQDFYDVNVIGTRNVLSCALKLGVGRVVHTSTCGVWGPTLNLPVSENDPRAVGFPISYERTKYLAELEVREFVKKGLEVVIVNPSRVYGDGPITDSNTVSKMVTGYINGTWHFIPGDGKSIANYAFVDDVVDGHIAAMQNGRNGERYILGGTDISFNGFFNTLKQLTGKQRILYKIPVNIIKAYSLLESIKTRLFNLTPFFLPEFADRLRCNQQYSSNKAITELNYRITPFAVGLGKTINHFKSN
ncbi:NAD-dependent epimerase/dehydratase family protein [Pedobacter sp. KBS0701]|uniref:NAD-dependent epimerase/dehydratase family protein n=1 Tax=Pedobacter sp. KBS0701 TaxID=2578106 RepID=UPI00110E4582|nr:NAD-dependent epimerase/dehydratase family protein [Pedobacter sp. KBS0701]QDW26615.1 NAD-dependent epimerase/dehydratase family protein [Pedobacter sp. KBS0701]